LIKSQTIEISFVSTSNYHHFYFISATKLHGSLQIPIQDPLTNTFVPSAISSEAICHKESTPFSSKDSTRSSEGDPTDTNVIKDKFLTSPQAYPSGVSAGQTIPQCVEWSYQGLVSFPDFANGVFNLQRWDKVEAKVSQLTTYETPVLEGSPSLLFPQFPVAKAY